MNRDSAILIGIVNEITDQRLDIAIEDKADDVPVAIDYRGAGVSADDVVGGDEIEGRGEIQFVFAVDVPLRKIEWLLVVEAGGAIVQAVEGGFVRSDGAVHRIALHLAIGKTQGKGRIGISVFAEYGETRLAKFFAGALLFALHVLFEPGNLLTTNGISL